MNAVNEMSTPVTRTLGASDSEIFEILEAVKDSYVSSEELGLVTVWDAMAFHTEARREEEILGQNPQSPTTKTYVALAGYGLYVANVVRDSSRLNGYYLTHLQKVESREDFLKQINREVDRTEEGKRMLSYYPAALS